MAVYKHNKYKTYIYGALFSASFCRQIESIILFGETTGNVIYQRAVCIN